MKKITKNSSRLKLLIVSALIFVLSLLLNINTLSNKFAFDDNGLILHNKLITEGTSFKEIFAKNYRYGAGNLIDGLYRPLVITTYVLNSKNNQLNPLPFHFYNIIINAINSSLLFLLIFFLTSNFLTALFSILLFSFHPIHTEAVANIAGRPELMCAFFIFLSWIALEKIRNRIISNIICSIFLFLALLSKETAIILPFMIIATDFAMGRQINYKYAINRYSLIFVTLICYFIIRWNVLEFAAVSLNPLFYNNPIANSPMPERIATALGVLLRYIILLIFPFRLSSDYSYNTISIYSSIWHFIPLTAVFITTIVLSMSFYFRKKNPVYLIACILFFFPYIIISNIFIPIGTIMGERLMYIPSAGFALLLGAIAAQLFNKWRYSIIISTIFILLTFSIRTIIRNRDWYDDYTITEADYKTSPNSVKLLFNMGNNSTKRGQYQNAEEYFKKALEIYPSFVESMSALGKIRYDQKRYGESLKYYARAAILSPTDPKVRFDHSAVLKDMGRLDEAEMELNEAIQLVPDSPIIFRGLGNIMLSRNNFKAAINNYNKALQLGGNKQVLINNMAGAYYVLGEFDSAFKCVKMAEALGIRLHPELVQNIRAKIDVH